MMGLVEGHKYCDEGIKSCCFRLVDSSHNTIDNGLQKD